MFKHNICGDQPEVPESMLDSSDLVPIELFENPRCPSTLVATQITVAEVDQSEETKEPEKSASIGD